jgi:DNA polymerase III subunit delta
MVKLAFKAIDGFAKNPPPDMLAVLLYGPDEGLIRERMNLLTRHVVPDAQDPFGVVEFSAGDLDDNPARLLDEAQSISMLGGRRVVRLRDADDKIANAVKSALEALRAGDNLVLVSAGELPPRSALRQMFEAAPNAAALPCYVEDERDIARVLKDGLKDAGYNMPSDALVYMAANVVGDRGVARSEIDKLVTYMGANRNITLDDVMACVGSSAALSLDDLSKHVASGLYAEADRILTFVLSEGVPAVTVLRTLQNYFTRLSVTRARIDRGENVEVAMKRLRPEVFWKHKAAFQSQVAGWSMEQLQQALALLMSVEAKCKQTGSDPNILCGRAVLSLAQTAARSLRRRA